MQEYSTDYTAEAMARDLLHQESWHQRTLAEFKQQLGSFEDNELRKILVRAGAVQLSSINGVETWGLVNQPHLQLIENSSG